MGRLTRAETQERNRARVLAAARHEFATRGFHDTKVDDIAERAELTRGAVYSNFAGKRALYLAVLAAAAEAECAPTGAEPGHTRRDVLGAFARAWLDRSQTGPELITEIQADDRLRAAYGQLQKLEAILLGLALERLDRPAGRLVRVAESALTTLHGASRLTVAAPGFVEPFDVVQTCERLADLDLDDAWTPAHLPFVPPARPVDEPWSPPEAIDALGGEPARLDGDGVVALLGPRRLEAVEEAVRAAPVGTGVTAVVITTTPDELLALARLAVTEMRGRLRRVVPPSARPALRIVLDESGAVATAARTTAVDDDTETALHIGAGRVVARATGRGACHAVAVMIGQPVR